MDYLAFLIDLNGKQLNGSKNYINKLEKITKAIFFKKEQVINS